MSGQWVLILYGALLLFIIFLQYRAIKLEALRNWVLLFAVEGFGAVLSAVIMVYFDHMPPDGVIPGLHYIGEVIFSMFAIPVFIFAGIISVVLFIIKLRAKRKKDI